MKQEVPLLSIGQRTIGFASTPRAGFTMLEMIGVLAVMAILASVLVPNLLKSIERAAVRAEAETLSNLGSEAKLYLRDTGSEPTNTNWNTVLAGYASLNPDTILTNRRLMNRVYVADPTAANQRAMIFSSMRSGAALPSIATIQANFSAIWDWTFDPILRPRPPGFNAASWPAEITRDFLLIELINFTPTYREEFQTVTITLNNISGSVVTSTTTGGNGNGNNGNGNNGNGNGNGNGNNGSTTTTTIPAVTASYRITRYNTTPDPFINLVAGATFTIAPPLHTRDKLELFAAASGSSPNYTYVVGTSGITFEFNGSQWISK